VSGVERYEKLEELIRMGAALGVAAVLLFLTVRFMYFSLAALARDIPYVLAGLMSAFFALLTLSGALILVRDLVIYRKAREAGRGEPGGK